MLLCKNKSSIEKKTVSLKDVFQASQYPVRKGKVYEVKVVTQNSAIKCYHEFHVRSHKNFGNVNIGGSFSVTNKSNLIVPLCKIKGTILRWKKFINWKNFLLWVIWMLDPCHDPLPCEVSCQVSIRLAELEIDSWDYIQSRDQRIMQLCALVAQFHKSSPCQAW